MSLFFFLFPYGCKIRYLYVMKKVYLVFTFLVLSFFGIAQSKVMYGFKAGVSSADMRGDAVQSLNNMIDVAKDYVTSGSRTGFYTGTYVNIPLGKTFSIEPGLYYAQKGYKLKGALNIKGVSVLGINAKAQLQMNYIEMPVLLKAAFGGVQLFAGPQVSYLTNTNLKVSAGALGINVFSYKLPLTGLFNHWDAGFTGGIGYQFGNGLNISASYDQGLVKVDAGKNINAYNRMMKIGIGFSF